MAREDPNRFAEWVVLLREQVPVVRRHLAAWAKACREEPRLIWQTSAVRYATYCLAGLIVVWGVLGVADIVAPPRPAAARPEATTADYHVICSNPECGYHFVVRRRFGFKKFPVRCPKCEQKTGEQARRCNSKTCQGRWVAPVRIDGVMVCPRCGEPFD